MQRLRKWWWLGLLLLPALVYAGLIVAAYIKPPLAVSGISFRAATPPAAVVEVVNHGRWPVTLQTVSVQGVLPPDEVGALSNRCCRLAGVFDLTDHEYLQAAGQLAGWWVDSQTPHGLSHGVSLVWYQDVDLRWLHCPTVRYRYLGWPMAARSFCRSALRGASLRDGNLPDVLTDWLGWRPGGSGVDYRAQRVGDDLWIMVAAGATHDPAGLILNGFSEEPGGGRARFHLRMITQANETGRPLYLTVPLRRGEPDPEVTLEVIPWADYLKSR